MTFPHHDYRNDPSVGQFCIVPAGKAIAINAPNKNHSGADLGATADSNAVPASSTFGQRLRDANVAQIILIHGTFAGNDAFGIVREVARLSKDLSRLLRSFGKQFFDSLVGDLGNYTNAYADLLSDLINQGHDDSITVRRCNWSGENHHLGRADGAMQLLETLLQSDLRRDQRVLLWGHSHGGNVLALCSRLIGLTQAQHQHFFAATRMHYRRPILGGIDLPSWEYVRQGLSDPHARGALPSIDCVTFGTPLRYRWDTNICDRMLHFVQHRPSGTESAVARLPESVGDLLEARDGDYVQHFGIGGTDFLHSLFAPRSWIPERRLRRILERTVRRLDLAKNLRKGHRVSLDGTTVLVDYPDTPQQWNRKVLGHAVYTRPEWLPFHLNEICQRFYAS